MLGRGMVCWGLGGCAEDWEGVMACWGLGG